MTKKVLITGSREFNNSDVMLAAISAEFDSEGQLIVIHGAARGADTLADRMCTASEYITVVKVPADWDHLPRWEAGPRRNRHMLDLLPDVVLAFKQAGAPNKGTQHCINEATSRGIPVKVFTSD